MRAWRGLKGVGGRPPQPSHLTTPSAHPAPLPPPPPTAYAGGVAEDLAAALAAGCGSYFRDDDKLYLRACSLLQRAEAAPAAGEEGAAAPRWGAMSGACASVRGRAHVRVLCCG